MIVICWLDGPTAHKRAVIDEIRKISEITTGRGGMQYSRVWD
jgi:hypothetical protein